MSLNGISMLKVQHTEVYRDRLEHWAMELTVADLLEKSLANTESDGGSESDVN